MSAWRQGQSVRRRFVVAALLAATCILTPSLAAQTNELHGRDASVLIQWLLNDGRELREVAFADVIAASTGRKILPFQTNQLAEAELLTKIGAALDQVLLQLNQTNHPAQSKRRINEVSSLVEAALKAELNRVPGFHCDYPKTAAGQAQRSGYPDLRLKDRTTGRVIYLDPKLFERGSRASTLRTFYFEPKKETNKVLEDGHHLLVGLEHDGKAGGAWRFLQWELIDLAKFRVRLKAEFQASNRDIYQPQATVSRSAKQGQTNGD